MSFVNLQSTFRGDLNRTRTLVLERVLLGFRRIPESCVVDGGNGEVLSDTLDPRRKTIDGRSVGLGERDLETRREEGSPNVSRGLNSKSLTGKERRTLIMES